VRTGRLSGNAGPGDVGGTGSTGGPEDSPTSSSDDPAYSQLISVFLSDVYFHYRLTDSLGTF
jgi:hypothetical protein